MLVLLAMILCICKYVCVVRHSMGMTLLQCGLTGKQLWIPSWPIWPTVSTQFTTEYEYHHQIPFLGVLIKRERKQYSSTPEETQTISVPVVSDLTPRLHPHSQTIFFAQREKIVWEWPIFVPSIMVVALKSDCCLWVTCKLHSLSHAVLRCEILGKNGDWTKLSYWNSMHKVGVCWTDTRPREGYKDFC